MTPSDTKLLADLEAAEARATKGKWTVYINRSGSREAPQINVEDYPDAGGSIGAFIADFWMSGVGASNDAALIALARNALPRLLELVRAQDVRIGHMEADGEQLAHYSNEREKELLAALRAIANGNHDYGMGGSCTVFCAACRSAKALGIPSTSPHPTKEA